jgi:hypothetical protein
VFLFLFFRHGRRKLREPDGTVKQGQGK